MFWDLYLLGGLSQASSDASRALAASQNASMDLATQHRNLQVLQQQVERLTLATLAMMEILRDRHGITEQEFEAKVREIDLRDGQLDGRIQQTRGPRTCPSCGRPNGPARTTCLYCSTPLPVEPLTGEPTVQMNPIR